MSAMAARLDANEPGRCDCEREERPMTEHVERLTRERTEALVGMLLAGWVVDPATGALPEHDAIDLPACYAAAVAAVQATGAPVAVVQDSAGDWGAQVAYAEDYVTRLAERRRFLAAFPATA